MSVLSRFGFGGRSRREPPAASNGSPTYSLRERDGALIEASLGLGDWIITQPQTTKSQTRAVKTLQDALRALPAARHDIIAEYGFHVRTEPEEGHGLYRAWRVALSPAGLEIYSVYSPDQKIEFEDKLSHELNFWLRPSHESQHDGYYYDEWIAEVADPDQFREEGAVFGILAELEPAPRR